MPPIIDGYPWQDMHNAADRGEIIRAGCRRQASEGLVLMSISEIVWGTELFEPIIGYRLEPGEREKHHVERPDPFILERA